MINRMIVKPKRSSGEGSLWRWSLAQEGYTRPGRRDSKREVKSFKGWFSMSKHYKHKKRIRTIRRRDPLKEELPRNEYKIGYID